MHYYCDCDLLAALLEYLDNESVSSVEPPFRSRRMALKSSGRVSQSATYATPVGIWIVSFHPPLSYQLGNPSPPSLCPLPPYNTSASPRPLSALTQTDPPRLGDNIPQTILTSERIKTFCFALPPSPPMPPTQLRRGITSSSRWRLILSSFLFFGGGV